MSIITLDQAKQQLNIDLDYTNDAVALQQYVDGITAVIEDYKHEVIEQRTITEDIEVHHPTRRFRLWSRPVISITSVVSVDGSRTWDPALMRVSPSGLVRILSGPPLVGFAVATIEAGYVTPPQKYVQGALVTLQHVWETRLGGGAVHSEVIGSEEHRYDPRYSYSIPRKALEWLGAPQPVVA
jgi:hypothetical protein